MSEMNVQFKSAALGLAVDLKSLLSPHILTPVLTLARMAVALNTSVGQARLCSLRRGPVSAQGKAPGEVEMLPNQHRSKLPLSCEKAGKILLGNTGSCFCFCRWDPPSRDLAPKEAVKRNTQMSLLWQHSPCDSQIQTPECGGCSHPGQKVLLRILTLTSPSQGPVKSHTF